MTIDAAITVVLLISLGCNILAFVYIRDLLGRLGWLTQNLANLSEIIKGFQAHIKGVYELQKFYGDEDIKLLVEHTNDLIEVMDDYLDVGLDTELIEEEQTTEDQLNDTKTTKIEEQKDVFYSDSRGRDSEVLRSGYNIHGKM
tara:strand:- start:1115 stop:1543 length:429 start_codon:yes stop_codon:yes gene_type:complete